MSHEERLLDAIGPLCEPLYDAFTNARMAAQSRNPEFIADADLTPVLTHVTRGLALHDLRGETSAHGSASRRETRASL